MPNQLVWADIPVRDMDRAIKFYSAVLGQEVRKHDMGGQPLGVLPESPGSVSGCLAPATGDYQPGLHGPLLYLNCQGRLDLAVAAVEPNGGKVVQPKHLLGQYGLRVLVLDSEGNRLALHSPGEAVSQEEIERHVAESEKVIATQPDQAAKYVGLARTLASQGHEVQAFTMCRKALATTPLDPEVRHAAMGLMSTLVPGYHRPMINDVRRNAAWDKALRRAVRPGSHVLEIGTGPGMLSLMAARAGAGLVTTCEFHPVVAEVAREIVAQNGFEDRIRVLAKGSLDLRVGKGADLEEPAELLFCDNFSDDMFSFQPLRSIADARARLLTPDAKVLPAAAAVRLALGHWSECTRLFHLTESCGFDVSFLGQFVPESIDLELGDEGITLLSEAQEAFRFDFSAKSYPMSGQQEVLLEATQDCVVNGILQWIRLELDEETVLEARPESGASFFSNPRFHPLPGPLSLRQGQVVRVQASHDSHSMALRVQP